MKNKKIILLICLVVIAAILIVLPYNSLVTKQEGVQTAWSQVESQYQRRADLVPNLVETVRGVAEFEQSTLIEVTEARAAAVQPVVDINNIDELVDFQERQTGLSQALSRLLMITENYPELSATENFRDLQVQLEGTENRIAVARMDYNNAVQSYNTSIRKFPGMITATILNFERAVRFVADEGAEEAPQVNLTD